MRTRLLLHLYLLPGLLPVLLGSLHGSKFMTQKPSATGYKAGKTDISDTQVQSWKGCDRPAARYLFFRQRCYNLGAANTTDASLYAQ